MFEIRPARWSDLEAIMAVEAETFGSLGAAASRDLMAYRIGLLNGVEPQWFFVACQGDRLHGDVILQPTSLRPEDCTSWEAATGAGVLEGTLAREGDNIYGVSLAVGRKAPPGTAEVLLSQVFRVWRSTKKKLLMFCSRMPGFAAAHQKTGVSAEDYMAKRRRSGGPRDPLLFLYWKWTGGAVPVRLLRDGYAVDGDSGGHGALIVLDDAAAALRAIAPQLPGCGLVHYPAGHANTEEAP